MDTAQIAVTVGGTALIGFILWFFFGPRTVAAIRPGGTGMRDVDDVPGGDTPDR